LAIEELVACGSVPAFDFHAALPGRLSPPLLGDQVVQGCAPRPKRLLLAAWMVHRIHHAPLPVDGMMGLSEPGTGHGYLRVWEDGIPAGLLLLQPLAYALTMRRPRREGDVVRHAASPLAEGTHPHALPLPHPVQQGVARDTACLRTGDAMATKFFGSLRSAWRSQGPRRAPGKSVRSLWVVLSKPAVRTPRTRYDGSCWDAAR
jgi:hypothetical protein